MYKKISIILISATCLFIIFKQALAQGDVIVSGYVYDSKTNKPLQGVKVEVEEAEDVSPALSNKSGKYTLVISGRTEARITFSKERYKTFTTLVKLTEASLKHDVRLEMTELSIEMTKFRSGAFIRGKVEGLKSAEYKNYVILVYVLTNKWYIHPFAEKRARRGYAPIDKVGNWDIATVWRGYQAYKVAFLLVSKDLYPPPTVDLLQDQDPEVPLLNAIESRAHKIITAPDGI